MYLAIARRKSKKVYPRTRPICAKPRSGPTVVSIVGVNGTGKTTTAAKLAHLFNRRKKPRCSRRATPSAPPPSNKSNSGARD
jgi:signal recognition particle GTPase